MLIVVTDDIDVTWSIFTGFIKQICQCSRFSNTSVQTIRKSKLGIFAMAEHEDPQASGMQLLDLVDRSDPNKCADPRDRIFALAPLASDAIRFKANYELSTVSLFRSLTRYYRPGPATAVKLLKALSLDTCGERDSLYRYLLFWFELLFLDIPIDDVALEQILHSPEHSNWLESPVKVNCYHGSCNEMASSLVLLYPEQHYGKLSNAGTWTHALAEPIFLLNDPVGSKDDSTNKTVRIMNAILAIIENHLCCYEDLNWEDKWPSTQKLLDLFGVYVHIDLSELQRNTVFFAHINSEAYSLETSSDRFWKLSDSEELVSSLNLDRGPPDCGLLNNLSRPDVLLAAITKWTHDSQAHFPAEFAGKSLGS